ncbi:MAG: hypothetical protein ABI113_10005, partial [Mucilaginibacter sp.]
MAAFKFYSKNVFVFILLVLPFLPASAQTTYELNQDWKCQKIADVKADGLQISKTDYQIDNWLPATVPGTVLTTLLN